MREFNFTREEFTCECGCEFDTIDYELINDLQDGREYFAKKYNTKIRVDITGGNRCETHNEVVQKQYNPNYVPFSSKTTHMKASAADHKYFKWENNEWIQIPPKEIYDYYAKKFPNSHGIGLYHNRVHLDRRTKKARWNG